MTHEIHASIRLTLPADSKEQAAALAKIAAEWAKLMHALDSAEASFAVGEAQERVVRRRRRRQQPNGDAMAAVDEFQRQAGVS